MCGLFFFILLSSLVFRQYGFRCLMSQVPDAGRRGVPLLAVPFAGRACTSNCKCLSHKNILDVFYTVFGCQKKNTLKGETICMQQDLGDSCPDPAPGRALRRLNSARMRYFIV